MTAGSGDTAAVNGFPAHQDHLFGVAYRMLGSVAEAEDVVQEAFLRWSAIDAAEVRSPRAYLTTVTTRLAIDRLRSAQHRRESYVGPWLPEPLMAQADEPAEAAELADSLTTAFLVLLERLDPVERAVFLLHDVFEYPFDEVAEVVERPTASCRQIASRARSRLADERRTRFAPTPAEEQRLILAFSMAATAGDLLGLLDVLAEDAVLWSDGGAAHHAARRPVVGASRVARFVANVTARVPAGAAVRMARLNGDPGLVVTTPAGPHLALSLELGDDGIRAIHVVVNPDKLRHLAVERRACP